MNEISEGNFQGDLFILSSLKLSMVFFFFADTHSHIGACSSSSDQRALSSSSEHSIATNYTKAECSSGEKNDARNKRRLFSNLFIRR